jgi:hypothetical protein
MNPNLKSFEDLEARNTRTAPVDEEGVKINGLEQVVQMLRYADPVFRQSMLKRIHARDPKLAQQIIRVLSR